MGMVYILRRASSEDLAHLGREPRWIHSFLAHGDPSADPSPPGFFARLLGARPAEKPPAWTAMTEEDTTDLDKAWDGLHWLYRRAPDGDAWPASFLLDGGKTIGTEDVGYGPARALDSALVVAVDAFLQRMDGPALRARFDGAAMVKADVYPSGMWADADTLEYALDAGARLRDFVHGTAERKLGLVTFLA